MTDESKHKTDDLAGLREELEKLREQVRRLSETVPGGRAKVSAQSETRGFGHSLSEYINDVMEGVFSGISSGIERSVFVDPTGVVLERHISRTKSLSQAEAQRAAALMGAMSSEHRLRILTELLYGGRYASELESVLKDISPSTLSSHLKTLQDAGLIVQESDRGRYLITLPGRIALKMATRLGRFLESRKS